MRFYQLIESRLTDKPKMGRDLNHIEDLVFFYGSDGAAEVVDILRDMTSDKTHDISIKWDGKVALFYGRDADGRFGMGTKGNWAKNNPAHTPQEIHDYIMTSGKGESFRPPMAKDLQTIFPYLEASVPSGFRGFVTGDLIFSPTLSPKQKSAKGIQFTPNQVTYTVNPSSEIGRLVNQAICGMALHIRFDGWKGTSSAAIDANTVAHLRTKDVLTLGQTYAPHAPHLDNRAIQRLEAMVTKYGPLVDAVIEKRAGLSDVSNIIYTFNNQTMRSGGNEVSVNTFFKWLESSKVSSSKQEKIKAMHEQNPNAFPALFELFNTVQQTKNDIIEQLDSNETDIRSSTNGERGGEGYVSLKHNVKLVPRTKWRPS